MTAKKPHRALDADSCSLMIIPFELQGKTVVSLLFFVFGVLFFFHF